MNWDVNYYYYYHYMKMVGLLFSILLWSWTSLYSFICNLLLMIISIKFWERRKRSGRMLESVHVIAMSACDDTIFWASCILYADGYKLILTTFMPSSMQSCHETKRSKIRNPKLHASSTYNTQHKTQKHMPAILGGGAISVNIQT